MKKIFFILATLSLVIFSACGNGSENGNGETPDFDFPDFTESEDRPEATTDLERINEIHLEAMESLDASLCEEIGDQVQYIACRYNTIANLAIKYNDPSLCPEIGDEEYIQECENLF